MMDVFLTNMQIFTSQDMNWWTWVVWFGEPQWHHCETAVFKNAKSQDAGAILLDIHPPIFFLSLVRYELIGSKVRVCRDGGWDGRSPVCERMTVFWDGFIFLLYTDRICLIDGWYMCVLQLCTVLHLQRSSTLRYLTPYMTLFPSVTCCPIAAALGLWWVRVRFTAPRAAPGALLLLSAKVRISRVSLNNDHETILQLCISR